MSKYLDKKQGINVNTECFAPGDVYMEHRHTQPLTGLRSESRVSKGIAQSDATNVVFVRTLVMMKPVFKNLNCVCCTIRIMLV